MVLTQGIVTSLAVYFSIKYWQFRQGRNQTFSENDEEEGQDAENK
jgi:hypothetical protein